MTDNIEVFPQSRTLRGKPGIVQAILDTKPANLTEMFNKSFPDATVQEIDTATQQAMRIIEARGRRAQAEADTMRRLGTVFERSGLPSGTPLIDAAELLAGQGDEEAVAILAELQKPERRLFDKIILEAVAADPFWEVIEDGISYRPLRGAAHKTPEELVAAYLKARGGEESYQALFRAGLLVPSILNGDDRG
jgi:hypothetical protein